MTMKMIISLIFYFFVLSLTILKTGEASFKYGSLIEKVYDEYKTVGIIIATTNNLSSEMIKIFQTMSREISARGIGSVIVKFTQLEETMKFHDRRSDRPLVVIFIDKITEIQEFKEGTVNIDMNYPVWLILFTGDEHEDICEYCRHSTESPFDMKMLFSCCNSSSIVKSSSQKTNYSSTLSRDQEIEKFSEIERHLDEPLFSGHSFPVNREFRIVIPERPSGVSAVYKHSTYALFVSEECDDIWRSGNQLYGYLGEIVMELSRVMNFSISHVWKKRRGGLQTDASSWEGAIHSVARNEADIGVAPFILDSNRLRAVDYSLSLMHGEYTLFIALSVHSSIQWSGFFKAFHPRIWMIIIILLLITPLLLIISEYKKDCNLYDIIPLYYLSVWGLFCQQSWSSPPLKKSSRIIFLSLFISTLVINASYSAALIRHLTTAPVYVQFRNVQEFINDGTYKVIATRDSPMYNWIKESNDTLVKKLKNMMKLSNFLPTNAAEGLKQLCTERVAFIGETTEGNFHWERPPCECISFKVGGNMNMGIIFPLKSEYTGLANYHIRRFAENGLLNRLKQKHFVKFNPTDLDYTPVSFEDIIPVLTIFAIECLIALIILRYEKR